MPDIGTKLEAVPVIPLCICVPPPVPPIEMSLPFGISVSATQSVGLPAPVANLVGFINQLNPLMAPLFPVLRIIDLAMALVGSVKAVPDAIASLSPGPIIEALEKLAAVIPPVLALVPPFSYLKMVQDLLYFCIQLLFSIKYSLEELLSLDPASMLAAVGGNVSYQCCVNQNIETQMKLFLESNKGITAVFKILAALLEVLKFPGIEKYIDIIVKIPELLAGGSLEASLSGAIEASGEVSAELQAALDFVASLGVAVNVLAEVYVLIGGTLDISFALGECGC